MERNKGLLRRIVIKAITGAVCGFFAGKAASAVMKNEDKPLVAQGVKDGMGELDEDSDKLPLKRVKSYFSVKVFSMDNLSKLGKANVHRMVRGKELVVYEGNFRNGELLKAIGNGKCYVRGDEIHALLSFHEDKHTLILPEDEFELFHHEVTTAIRLLDGGSLYQKSSWNMAIVKRSHGYHPGEPLLQSPVQVPSSQSPS